MGKDKKVQQNQEQEDDDKGILKIWKLYRLKTWGERIKALFSKKAAVALISSATNSVAAPSTGVSTIATVFVTVNKIIAVSIIWIITWFSWPGISDYMGWNTAAEKASITASKETTAANIFKTTTVNFKQNSANLDAQAVQEIILFVKHLTNATAALKVNIEGHTCNLGNHGYNQELSKMRADAVKEVLIKNGVDPSRIAKPQGFSYDKPLSLSNKDTEEGRRKNRRCELSLKQ